MASPHQIAASGLPVLNFEFWRRDPPPIICELVTSFTKPGTNGFTAKRLGQNHATIVAELVSHWPSYAAAMAMLATYRQYPGSKICSVTYNTIPWSNYGIGFLVEAMEFRACQARHYLIGPGYAYQNGAELITEWHLTPQPTESVT